MGEGESHRERIQNHWDYDTYFREYLLLLARKGEDGLESSANFPKTIELSPIWHETLNNMRLATRGDGIERWALIGYREDMQHIVLPTVFGLGVKGNLQQGIVDHVPTKVIQDDIQKAKEKTGVVGLVGDIHTHPRPKGETKYDVGFSPSDLYLMLIPGDFRTMMVVVEPKSNLVVFKTRESTDISLISKIFPQAAFDEYWENKYKQLPGSSLLDMNKDIAKKHNLVVYRGKKGSNLQRIFP